MYTGYYMERSDGDGELIAVIAGESITPLEDEDNLWLITALNMIMNKNYGELGIGWFAKQQGTCDFPDIWEAQGPSEFTTFKIDFSVKDLLDNELHVYRDFTCEGLYLAQEEAREMAIALNRAYQVLDFKIIQEE